MSEKTDHLDHSAEISEQLRSAAEQAVRRAAQPEYHPNFDGKHCVEDDCGVELPQARIEIGRVRCVDCQNRLEKARGHIRIGS